MANAKRSGQPQWIKAGGAVVLLAAAVLLAVKALSPARATATPFAYFYNIETGQLTAARKVGNPPFELPPDGMVLAMVFSCGDCADESSRFIGWLESYSAEGLAELRAASEQALQGPAASQLMMDLQMMRVVAPPPQQGRELVWAPQGDPRVTDLQMRAVESCRGAADGSRAAISCIPEGG